MSVYLTSVVLFGSPKKNEIRGEKKEENGEEEEKGEREKWCR